jgi:neutral trehalase
MDPNNAIRPDYVLDEFQEERQQLIDEGLTEAQAIRSLTVLWNVNNNAERAHWAARQEHLEEAHQQAEEDDTQRQQDLRDEEEAAHIEDRKKNKNKYAPLKRIKIPTDPTVLQLSTPSEGSKPAITVSYTISPTRDSTTLRLQP